MKINYNKLFECLKQKKITQEQMRKDLNIDNNIFSNLENNKSVTMETIGKLCEYLHVQPGDIVEIRYNAKTLDLKEKILETEKSLTEYFEDYKECDIHNIYKVIYLKNLISDAKKLIEYHEEEQNCYRASSEYELERKERHDKFAFLKEQLKEYEKRKSK